MIARHTTPILLKNARVVLADEVAESLALLIEDGAIRAFDPAALPAGTVEHDLQGKCLLPGLIDLHCDALEKEVEPRPGVHFPLAFACAQADRRNAMAGITTVFHALSFANEELGVRSNTFAAEIARFCTEHADDFLVENRIHTRYEVTDASAVSELLQLMDAHATHLISFMDHSPGQGQFADIDAYRNYLQRTYKTDAASLDALLERKQADAAQSSERIQQLAEHARKHQLVMAGHDDDSREKVQRMHGFGTTISEFPTNLEAAQTACDLGMATLFGAPNILRGQSQSGNMKALDAVNHGVAVCLCSDYAPATLLPAVLRLPELADITLPQAVAMVTRHPAAAAGLHDRGEIAIGKRANLIAIDCHAATPLPTDVWVGGQQVLSIRG
ncbi:MAG: alpha-D-ribose 1-methylphosphonate 5-triphosphate diphosphatase [Opitutales bacterium]